MAMKDTSRTRCVEILNWKGGLGASVRGLKTFGTTGALLGAALGGVIGDRVGDGSLCPTTAGLGATLLVSVGGAVGSSVEGNNVGDGVGSNVLGEIVGESVGRRVGALVVGASVRRDVGFNVGLLVGFFDIGAANDFQEANVSELTHEEMYAQMTA
jgi:hypothetical protein